MENGKPVVSEVEPWKMAGNSRSDWHSIYHGSTSLTTGLPFAICHA
jgi:hypothetical protein